MVVSCFTDSVAGPANNVDLFCVCKATEKRKVVHKAGAGKEHEIHSNPECPFRRINRVEKWQLKAES